MKKKSSNRSKIKAYGKEIAAKLATENKAKSKKKNLKLLKRTDPRKLDPKDCCFIFSPFTGPFFRIYHRKDRKKFTDYQIRQGVTPFVKLVDDDIELKDYLTEDGTIEFWMDFPEPVLRNNIAWLKPGESWLAE